jgi:hypothetical protein
MDSSAQDRVAVVEAILKVFLLERILFLVFNALIAIVLLGAGIRLISHGADKTEIGFIFGASGLLTSTVGGFLYMFKRTMQVAFPESKEGERANHA